MERKFQWGDEELRLSANQTGEQVKLTTDDGDRTFDWVKLRDGEYLLREDGRQHRVVVARSGKERWVWINGQTHKLTIVSGRRRREDDDAGSLAAPMNGLVLKVLVAPGDQVTKKQPLIVLEAMKMQYEITAPRDGAVASVNCSEGEQVQGGTSLVSLEEEAKVES